MMKTFWLIVTFSYAFAHQNHDEIIKEINSKQNSWIAGTNFYHGKPMTHIHHAMPYDEFHMENSLKDIPIVIHNDTFDIPESFDARTKWPKCKTIGVVTDQGACIACWAIASTNAASDRICIKSDGKLQPILSAQQVLSCVGGYGCRGGDQYLVWEYLRDHGIVTGGTYNSNLGCQPYTFAPCEHHFHGPKPDCPSENSKTPECSKTCSNTSIKFEEDLIKGGDVYMVQPGNTTQMQIDIIKNGPITGWMIFYDDFVYYKSGVYHRTTEVPIGLHTVRIIGWGVENGTDYWLVVNSWNEDWGEKGMIKVLRGKNECAIERYIVVGLAK